MGGDADAGVLSEQRARGADTGTGDMLTITAPVLPGWLTLVGSGGGAAVLTGTPGALDVLLNSDVTLQVADAAALTDTQSFTITITNVNDAPVFTSLELEAVTEGQEYIYLITTVDPDLDPVTLTTPTLPTWLTLTDNGDGTGELRGTPTGAEVGVHPVELQVQENAPAPGLTGGQVFTVTVTGAADGPVITLNGAASITVTRGGTFTDPGATANDPQDGDLTAQIVVAGLPNTAVAATYTVTYSVQDTAGNSAQVQRTVIVQAPAPPPSSGGGGGSIGLTDLLLLTIFGCVAGLGRRRAGPNGRPCTSTANRRN